MINIGIILAAGSSERFKSAVHKQYLKLNGKEVIYYSINAMRSSECFQEIIAIVDSEEYESRYISEKYNIKCLAGGKERNNSIKVALDYVASNYDINHTNIVFHDCARPIIKANIFKEYIDMLKKYSGVAACSQIVDSLVTSDGAFVNRKEYRLIRTPEAFRFKDIYDDFEENRQDTAIINQIKNKNCIYLYDENTFDFKISYPEDLFLAEQLMRINYFRTYKTQDNITQLKGKILLLGGGGGVGQAVKRFLDSIGADYYAPSHSELDLRNLSVERINNNCLIKPDIIINVAATYANDNVGLIETFDDIFDVNLKANLVLIEYAKTLRKKVNIVLLSSSSSTRGRENLTNYSAAKAALNSIVESQGHILHELGICLNAIIPEKINTPLIEKLHNEKIDERELLDVMDVVGAIVEYSQTNEYGKLVHVRKGL